MKATIRISYTRKNDDVGVGVEVIAFDRLYSISSYYYKLCENMSKRKIIRHVIEKEIIQLPDGIETCHITGYEAHFANYHELQAMCMKIRPLKRYDVRKVSRLKGSTVALCHDAVNRKTDISEVL
jgi:ribosomal protein S3AE